MNLRRLIIQTAAGLLLLAAAVTIALTPPESSSSMVSFYQRPADSKQHTGEIVAVTAPESTNPRYTVALSDTDHPVPVEVYAWAAAPPYHQSVRAQYAEGQRVLVAEQGGIMSITGLEPASPGERQPNTVLRYQGNADDAAVTITDGGIVGSKGQSSFLLTPLNMTLEHVEGDQRYYFQTDTEGIAAFGSVSGFINRTNTGASHAPTGSLTFVARRAPGVDGNYAANPDNRILLTPFGPAGLATEADGSLSRINTEDAGATPGVIPRHSHEIDLSAILVSDKVAVSDSARLGGAAAAAFNLPDAPTRIASHVEAGSNIVQRFITDRTPVRRMALVAWVPTVSDADRQNQWLNIFLFNERTMDAPTIAELINRTNSGASRYTKSRDLTTQYGGALPRPSVDSRQAFWFDKALFNRLPSLRLRPGNVGGLYTSNTPDTVRYNLPGPLAVNTPVPAFVWTYGKHKDYERDYRNAIPAGDDDWLIGITSLPDSAVLFADSAGRVGVNGPALLTRMGAQVMDSNGNAANLLDAVATIRVSGWWATVYIAGQRFTSPESETEWTIWMALKPGYEMASS